jgi:hypothetical protein
MYFCYFIELSHKTEVCVIMSFACGELLSFGVQKHIHSELCKSICHAVQEMQFQSSFAVATASKLNYGLPSTYSPLPKRTDTRTYARALSLWNAERHLHTKPNM